MADTIPLHPDAVQLAGSSTFADSEGGPLIVMSASLAPAWNGAFDDQGNGIYGTSPCDYDRACSVSFDTVDVGGRHALVLEEPTNSAFIPTEGGAMIASWVGADDAETLISAALALTDDAFTRDLPLFEHDGGKLLMFDAASRGRTLDPHRVASIELPAGRYAGKLCPSWMGGVTGSDGNRHDVMVQAIRLHRTR